MHNTSQSKNATTSISIHVRVSPQIFERIKKAQAITGESAPTILKNAFVNNVQRIETFLTRDEAREALTELRRIGNNINQIAKHLNAGFGFEACNKFPEVYQELKSLRDIFMVKSGIHQR